MAEGLGLVMVLPVWPADYWEGGAANMLPFSHFYDEDFFISELWRTRKLNVSKRLPERLVPTCFAQLQMQDLYANETEGCPSSYADVLRRWVRRNEVACMQSRCSFTAFGERHYDFWRPAMRPAALYAAEIKSILEILQRRYNTTSFMVVHGRVEDEFKRLCAGVAAAEAAAGDAAKRLTHQCYVTESEILTQMDKLLKHAPPDGKLLFVASGDPLEAFPTLCARYRCFKRETLKPELSAAIPRTWTTQGFVDFLLARRGTRFFGNRFSTFSRELAHTYRSLRLGRAQMYNPERVHAAGAAAATAVAAQAVAGAAAAQ